MTKPPAYYRARLEAIRQAIAEADEENVKFLRNGYMPDLIIHDYSRYDNSPLSFLELTSFDTFFQIYPEKVCGETVKATSRAFPLKVKGTKEDVIRTIKGQADELRIRIAKVKLKLLKLKFQ